MKQESHATVHASSKVTKDTESQWAVTSFQTKNIMPTNQIHGCQRDFQTQCQLDGCLRIYRSFVIQIFSTEFPSDLRGLHRIKIWWYKVRRRGEQVQADQKRELKSRTCKAKEKGKKKSTKEGKQKNIYLHRNFYNMSRDDDMHSRYRPSIHVVNTESVYA